MKLWMSRALGKGLKEGHQRPYIVFQKDNTIYVGTELSLKDVRDAEFVQDVSENMFLGYSYDEDGSRFFYT